MNIQGVYKCPHCGGNFNKCKPSGPERVFAVCWNCDLVVFIEDLDAWKAKMEAYHARKMAQNAKYGGPINRNRKTYNYFEQFKKPEKKEKPFNPTER